MRLDRAEARAELGLRERPAHPARDGWQPRREWNQPGDDSSAAVTPGCADPGDPPLRHARRASGRRQLSPRKCPAFVGAFHHRMEEAYSAADLVVASGSGQPCRVGAFSLPAILIPFPYATEDHQTRNADIFVARMGQSFKEAEIAGDMLGRNIRELARDEKARQAKCRRNVCFGAARCRRHSSKHDGEICQ